MVALLVVRVDNATPIILNCEKSVTLGTLGTLVAVHEALTRNGRAVCRCGVDENPGGRLLEIPQWMFDSVACCRMRMAAVPTVSCGALLDLKALLRCALFPDSAVVLQDQHRSLLSPGGADARIIRESLSRQRVAQFRLFHPPQKRPSWQVLPPETKRKTVRLLARLLREHIGRVRASGSRKEASDE